MRGTQKILLSVVVILLCVNAYFVFNLVALNQNPVAIGPVFQTAEAFVAPLSQADYLPALVSSAADVTLDAKAAIVYDVNAQRNLYGEHTEDRLPIASLTKILTATVVWENFSPNDIVTVGSSAIKVDHERQDLYLGEEISVNSLLKLMLIESSNDAAYALRDYAATKGMDLVATMNAKALALGMHNTHIVDAAGLEDTGYSTAADLVKLVQYALQYDAIWNFSREKTAVVTSSDGKISHDIKSTDDLLGTLANIFGGKTGYTDNALGCILLIIDVPAQASSSAPEDKIIAIILGSHGRFETVTKLVDWVKSSYRWH